MSFIQKDINADSISTDVLEITTISKTANITGCLTSLIPSGGAKFTFMKIGNYVMGSFKLIASNSFTTNGGSPDRMSFSITSDSVVPGPMIPNQQVSCLGYATVGGQTYSCVLVISIVGDAQLYFITGRTGNQGPNGATAGSDAFPISTACTINPFNFSYQIIQ